MYDKIIFHVDVNSAYVSWEAVHRLTHGDTLDIRTIPSVVGGDPKTRHGIVLAKSIPAIKYNILTGESIMSASKKCPILHISPPDYSIYMQASNAMVEIFREYSPIIERYSVDECFLDFTGMQNIYKDPIKTAHDIKDRIKHELGFTVNVGISSNKLLAKMASDFSKPDQVHTCFPEEMEAKMWVLPIEDLFMVGRSTAPKLKKMQINTIGNLAKTNPERLKYNLKSFGLLLWQYANGIDLSNVHGNGNHIEMKGLGNSTTIPFDITHRREAHMVLISLTETVAMRLRSSGNYCSLVAVSIRTKDLENYSHQKKIGFATDNTNAIINLAVHIFNEVWRGEPIRHLGVRVSALTNKEYKQVNLYEGYKFEKHAKLDNVVDKVRFKYGEKSIIRSAFLHSGIKPINGGVGDEGDFPVMSNML